MSVKTAIFNGIDTTISGGASEMLFDLSPFSGSVEIGDQIVAIIDLSTLIFSPTSFVIKEHNRLSQPLGIDLTANKYLGIFSSN